MRRRGRPAGRGLPIVMACPWSRPAGGDRAHPLGVGGQPQATDQQRTAAGDLVRALAIEAAREDHREVLNRVGKKRVGGRNATD